MEYYFIFCIKIYYYVSIMEFIIVLFKLYIKSCITNKVVYKIIV